MINNIKKFIPKQIINFLKDITLKKQLRKLTSQIYNKYESCVFFIAVPSHGNLGDQAIVYSQYKMFEDLGLGDRVIEIKSNNYTNSTQFVQSIIRDTDTIVIDGGGNMGTLWIEEEYKMRDIVTRFPNNKIIIFPETVFYSKDDKGELEFEKSKVIYNNHKNLHICVRDKRSYELIKNEYHEANIVFVPDIVLYLDNLKLESNERKDALLCIRKDKEKSLDKETIQILESVLKKNKLNVKYTSTLIEKSITKKNREIELYKKWNEFASAKIVVTDRLHGMIFAAITGTSCIALNNSNGKVKGVYEWINRLPYIYFLEDSDKLEDEVNRLINLDHNSFNNEMLKKDFDKISYIIKK